jgi:hypothetical protein
MTRAIEVLVLSCDRRSVFAERLDGALGKKMKAILILQFPQNIDQPN